MPLTIQNMDAIAARCPTRWDRYYTKAKLRSDPVYGAIENTLRGTTLPVLDIGCGIGLLTHWLRGCGIDTATTGIDFDERKITSAQQMARGMTSVSFCTGDARHDLPQHRGHVVILDVLQYFQTDEQNALLNAAAARVAPGGRLLIRSGLRGPSWRYKVTIACDWLARLTFWMKSSPVVYPDAEQFHRVLEAEGLKVSVSPLWGGTPFYNHLIVAERPESPA